MRWIKDAEYTGGYKIKLKFGNHERKLVDLEDRLDGKIYEPLKDISFFKKVNLNSELDTIVWLNDTDFAPEYLYDIGKPIELFR